MSYNLVNPTTGDLTRVAGGTLYADLPIGSWIKNDMGTLPSGFLKEGDTISQSECPELYAKYGSTVPYRADKSELDSYSTNVSYSMLSSSSGYTMLYDGFIEIRMQGSSGQASPVSTLTVNNSTIMQCGNYNDGARKTQSFFFRKGDVLKVANANSSSFECKIAYYKKSLIVKAKNTPVPADFKAAIDDAMNSVDFATILSGTANVSVSDYICSRNIKNVCAMIKCHTNGIVSPSTKICSGFFTPLTSSTYAYLDIPFAIRNRNTNVTEMRMGYLDTNGDFYTSAYTENIESDWDIQLFFSYITD
jgi:hypothetical protein